MGHLLSKKWVSFLITNWGKNILHIGADLLLHIGVDLLQIRAAIANQCKFITNNRYRYYKSRQLLQAGA